MTDLNVSESELLQIEAIERDIRTLRAEQAEAQGRVKQLLCDEDPSGGIFFNEEIFRLQQDKLRIDTEIQFREVALRRLKSTW